MTDDQWLRDTLGAAVPEPPSVPDRAVAARRRAGLARRRTAAGVCAGAVLAVAAVVVPLTLGGSGSPAPTPQAPTHRPTSGPAPAECPPADTEPTGPATLPDGAVAVRLCDGPGVGFDEPDDALVTGIDELVRVVNAQEVTGRARSCHLDLGRGYLLAFAYPDGTVRSVTGELYGCHQLFVGSTVRAAPERPWARFIDLLREQRTQAAPPTGLATRPSCEDPSSETGTGTSPVGLPGDMRTAVLCVRYDTATQRRPLEVEVADADLSVLLTDRRDLTGEVAPPKGCAGPSGVQLVGRTAWGDLETIDAWCGRWTDGRGRYWDPGPAAQRILDRLVAEAGTPTPTVDATSSAADVVAAYVDLLNAGDRRGAAELWHPWVRHPALPVAGARIDYKLQGVHQLRFISAWQDATAVEAIYREQAGEADASYRTAVFTLGRDDAGVLRIVSMQLGQVVETGR